MPVSVGCGYCSLPITYTDTPISRGRERANHVLMWSGRERKGERERERERDRQSKRASAREASPALTVSLVGLFAEWDGDQEGEILSMNSD